MALALYEEQGPGQAKARVLGVELDPLTLDETLDRVEAMIEAGEPRHHLCLNAAKAVEINRDIEMEAIARNAALVSADGMAVVWAGRLLGQPLPERVTGIDLMDALLERAAHRRFPVYFLGASRDVVRRAVRAEVDSHAGLVVAGWRDGYWSDDEEDKVVAEIAAARPAILLVALPSPKKERFIARHLQSLGVPFVMGVGGSFDVVAGLVSRAPGWMQAIGLEWFHRFLQEPGRMWRRYLNGNVAFTGLVMREWLLTRGMRW